MQKHLLQALLEKDVYLYIGHGSGQQVLSRQALQSARIKSAALLIGCCSASLSPSGEPLVDPHGYAVDLMLNGSPLLAGCLWDITDKDSDMLLIEVLRLLGDREGSLSECIQKSRKYCRLRYLNGAAFVVYGMPLSISYL